MQASYIDLGVAPDARQSCRFEEAVQSFSGDNVVKRMKDIKAQLEKPITDEDDVEHKAALLEELLIIVEDIDCAKGAHRRLLPSEHSVHHAACVLNLGLLIWHLRPMALHSLHWFQIQFCVACSP